jgi:hypothetical protein
MCALRTANSSGVKPPLDFNARSARFEEHIDGRSVAFSRRPHQRGLTFVRFLRIDLRAARQQQPDGICLSDSAAVISIV